MRLWPVYRVYRVLYILIRYDTVMQMIWYAIKWEMSLKRTRPDLKAYPNLKFLYGLFSSVRWLRMDWLGNGELHLLLNSNWPVLKKNLNSWWCFIFGAKHYFISFKLLSWCVGLITSTTTPDYLLDCVTCRSEMFGFVKKTKVQQMNVCLR